MTDFTAEETFKALGFDESYFYFLRLTPIGGIVRLSADEAMTEYGCRRVVRDLSFWKLNYPINPKASAQQSEGVDWIKAGKLLMRICLKSGFYHPQAAARKTDDISFVRTILSEVCNRWREDKIRDDARARGWSFRRGDSDNATKEAFEKLIADTLSEEGPAANNYFDRIADGVLEIINADDGE